MHFNPQNLQSIKVIQNYYEVIVNAKRFKPIH